MLRLVAIIAAAVCVPAHAADVQTISARVVGVRDGDTLTALTDDKRQLKVRLHGIDAPELGQPFGQASKRALSDLVFGKQVTLHITGTDRYKRTLARVTVDDIEVDAQMIVTGHAWHYSRYATRHRWKPQSAPLGPQGVGYGLTVSRCRRGSGGRARRRGSFDQLLGGVSYAISGRRRVSDGTRCHY
jgi:endonuclease YncB( thermonuclease family)